MGKNLSIYDTQDILRDDQRQFDKIVAELKKSSITSLSKRYPTSTQTKKPCDGC